MSSEWSSAILLIILFCSVFCGIVSWWPCVLLLLVLCGTGLCNATGCLVQIICTAVFLACLVLVAVFFSLFPYFSLTAGLMSVSSSSSSCCFVRAAVVCSSSTRMLFFLRPFLPSRITLFKTPVVFYFRPCAGIFFLVFVLFGSCSSYLLLFSTYVVLLAAYSF